MALSRQVSSHPQMFFATSEQRTALARERFFEEGQRPSGLVSEAVIQSWYRCWTAGRDVRQRPELEPVSRLQLATALRGSRVLREAAEPGLGQLEAAIAGTPCQVILTNPQGRVVYTSRRADRHEEPLMCNVARLGVDLSEPTFGTNAPGIVLQTGHGCEVLGGEHFNAAVGAVQCAAAPIRNIRDELAGVLNISVEGRSFGFDALALIGAYARTIETMLVTHQAQTDPACVLLLWFQVEATLLDSPQVALVVVDEEGTLVWLNEPAVRLTEGCPGQSVEQVLGRSMPLLERLLRHGALQRLCLPSGLHVWMRSSNRVQSERRGSVAEPCAVPAEAVAHRPHEQLASAADRRSCGTLHDRQDAAIRQALQDCDGNVSRAARQLGVSRGLIYRHLRTQPPTP